MRLKASNIMQKGDIIHYKKGSLNRDIIVDGWAGSQVSELFYDRMLDYVERPAPIVLPSWSPWSWLPLYLLWVVMAIIVTAIPLIVVSLIVARFVP
jgi:hypothetical protein